MKKIVGVVWLLVGAAIVGQSSHQSADSLNETLLTRDTQCPLWQSKDRATNLCRCIGSSIVVRCTDDPYHLGIQECYCMTHRHQQVLVGSCLYTCHRAKVGYILNITGESISQINEKVCGPFKREGQMCGRCIPGHAPPVYSYSFTCVNCTTSNWGKYLAVSLLPSTAFFVFAVVFRISATSPSLNGFILFNQILTSAPTMRALEITLAKRRGKFTPAERSITQVFVSLSGVWNLDFFRLVYNPFCLQPNTNNLQVVAMDYLTAVYPLLLIASVYLLVLLYDRNVRLVVWLCKPVVLLLIRFRRQWNIKHSLVDAFATFLLLSYVKILSVSVDILLPTVFYGYHRYPKPLFAPFIQGDIPYFGSQHLPYACLALFFLLTFTLLPMFLLFLYPCSWFQVCLNRTGLSCQSLHIFMDSFQGHYKNGTDGTLDLRFFSGTYLLIRGLVYVSTALAYQISSYGYTTIFLIGFTAIVALARPFKKFKYNFSDVFFLSIITMLFVCLITFTFSSTLIEERGLLPASFALIFAVLVYIITLLLCWIKTNSLVLKCCSKMRHKVKQCLPSRRKCGYESLLNY